MKTIHHTSPAAITEINNFGRFGDCLFFSCDPYVMTAAADPVIYKMDIDDDHIIEVGRFFYDDNSEKLDDLVNEIMDRYEIQEETAQNLLDDSENAFDIFDDAEDAAEASWDIQQYQGRAAKILGYVAAESEDEQGSVYIVAMTGLLERLELV